MLTTLGRLLFLLCLGIVGCARAADDCEGAPDFSCAAFQTLGYEKGTTACTGKASVDCAVVQDAGTSISSALTDWLDAFCEEDGLDAATKATAEAFASVLVNGLEKIRCEGQGIFCGFSVSDTSWSSGLQEMFAHAASVAPIADITGDDFCFADLRSVADQVQGAVEGASAICTQGGSSRDYFAYIVAQVSPGIQDALRRARVRTCRGRAAADRSAARATACSRFGGRSAAGGAAKRGDPCGGMAFAKECAGSGAALCCDRSFTLTICTCAGCNGPWIRDTGSFGEGSVFSDADGSKCICPTTA